MEKTNWEDEKFKTCKIYVWILEYFRENAMKRKQEWNMEKKTNK